MLKISKIVASGSSTSIPWSCVREFMVFIRFTKKSFLALNVNYQVLLINGIFLFFIGTNYESEYVQNFACYNNYTNKQIASFLKIKICHPNKFYLLSTTNHSQPPHVKNEFLIF